MAPNLSLGLNLNLVACGPRCEMAREGSRDLSYMPSYQNGNQQDNQRREKRTDPLAEGLGARPALEEPTHAIPLGQCKDRLARAIPQGRVSACIQQRLYKIGPLEVDRAICARVQQGA